jgi:flagellar motor switch protein FliN
VFQPLQAMATGAGSPVDVERILDVPVQLTAELGRTRITIKSLLQLSQGSVVELDGLAGQPLDVLINGYLIAQGEVVVVNEKYGIRLTDIVTPSERMQKLGRSCASSPAGCGRPRLRSRPRRALPPTLRCRPCPRPWRPPRRPWAPPACCRPASACSRCWA